MNRRSSHLRSSVGASLKSLPLALYVALLAVLGACTGEDTSRIEIRVVSDLVPRFEVGTATAVLYRGEANATDVSVGSVERALEVGEPLARGLWLASFEGIEPGTYTAWVTLARDNGEVLGKRPLTFTLESDASFTITLTADCTGVACPNGGNASFLACVAGSCVDPRCTAETPEHCPADLELFCGLDTECDVTIPCGAARCESGACLQAPAESECGTDEYCSALSGCTLEERPDDAPEDVPGPCGNACSLEDRPCVYAYVACSEELSGCTAAANRPAGAPCPNGGICDANGECVPGARSDAGTPDDMGSSGDLGIAADMNVVFDAAVAADMSVVVDAAVAADMAVVVDAAVAADMAVVDGGTTPCASGYLGTVETGCYDIDECSFGACDRLTACTNSPGSFTCTACPSGYTGNGKTGCDDIDECAFDGCDALTTCTNTAGNFVCSACPRGYTGTGKTGCDDVDECSAGLDDCWAVTDRCENEPGTFACEREQTVRVSVSADGTQGNGGSSSPFPSADGTVLVFTSSATNLVAGDTNGKQDVFAKDLRTGVVRLVSTASDGTLGNESSTVHGISPDGTRVLIQSNASNFVAGDTNASYDIFVKNLATGAMTLVSSTTAGVIGNSTSYSPSFSSDGARVVFGSTATNFAAGDTNGSWDVFVKDLATGVLRVVSTSASGTIANGGSYGIVFSPDGTRVLFYSDATNLVAGDTNGVNDTFVKDIFTGAIRVVSTSAAGTFGNAATAGGVFSPDSTRVLFTSAATNLVTGDTNGVPDLFVKDLLTGTVQAVAETNEGTFGNGMTSDGEFSPDGGSVFFSSNASNLVAGDTNGFSDAFIKNLRTGEIALMSVTEAGVRGNQSSFRRLFLPNSGRVLFESAATNFTAGDTNGVSDHFIKDLTTGALTVVSTGIGGALTNSFSSGFSFSNDGRWMVWVTSASNIVTGDTNSASDIFLRRID